MQQQFAKIKNKIHCDSSAQITDYQYNVSGSHLAVSDSEGNVHVYQRQGDSYKKVSQFSGDDASVWKVCWAHPKYGRVLAIGSFKKKVAIFQEKNNEWIEMAFHTEHEGSVNSLCFAPVSFGLKLFAGGSDGKVSVIVHQGNGWGIFSFQAHEWAINSITVQGQPLNQEEKSNEGSFPRLATASKDLSLKIWQDSGSGYKQIASHTPHKQMIRSILWRPTWSQCQDSQYQVISCSQEGTVKVNIFDGKGFKIERTIVDQELPITRISQSITGNLLNISLAGGPGNSKTLTIIAQEKQKGQWNGIESFNQI